MTKVHVRHCCATPRLTLMLVLLILPAACGGGSGPPVRSVSPAQVREMPLMVGDALRVTFSRETNLNGEFVIDETGTAGLPILGEVQVTDRPATRLKEDLEADYAERTRNQLVQVTYLRRVRVLGEVRNPGLFRVDPTMTVSDVLALAGGVTTTGKLDKVRLTRDGQVIYDAFDPSLDPVARLQSGDELFVARTSWFSRNAAWIIGATISAASLFVAVSN